MHHSQEQHYYDKVDIRYSVSILFDWLNLCQLIPLVIKNNIHMASAEMFDLFYLPFSFKVL